MDSCLVSSPKTGFIGDFSREGVEKLNELRLFTFWDIRILEEDSELDMLRREKETNTFKN